MQMMGGGMMGGMMGGGMMGGGMMGGGMMGGGTQGEQMHIARFGVMRKARQPAPRVILPPASTESREPRHTLTTRLAFRHMRGFLNGREFELETVANDERVPRNEQLLWTFEHDESRGMNMLMPHPMHLHGVRFRIVERQRGAGAPADVADGLIDQGYKDSMLVFPGERVKLLLAATEPGLFMYHCHNLEHEDAGMMRNFLVEGS
jgi:bilirubin oxidase